VAIDITVVGDSHQHFASEAPSQPICHSGGAKGADALFGQLALEARHLVRHYSFLNHHIAKNPECAVVLNVMQLAVADKYLIRANDVLGRKFPSRSEYVNNLLRRNYYQVKESTSVFASTPLDENMIPTGGTAWALIMAINLRVPNIYNFDWTRDVWFRYNYGEHTLRAAWEEIERESVPDPTGQYAGIGSSELPENGQREIIYLYKR
jgi:hypothetical protein